MTNQNYVKLLVEEKHLTNFSAGTKFPSSPLWYVTGLSQCTWIMDLEKVWADFVEENTCSSVQSWDNVSSTDSSSREKKTKNRHQFWEQQIRNVNALLFIHVRIGHLGLFADRQISVWMWALHNPSCTGAGAGTTSAHLTQTTQPVEGLEWRWQDKDNRIWLFVAYPLFY